MPILLYDKQNKQNKCILKRKKDNKHEAKKTEKEIRANWIQVRILWHNTISWCFMTNEGSLKCDLHSIPIANNNRQKKHSSIAFHESILVNHYFRSCEWVSLCVFYSCWTQVAKHNKSPKRMQSSIQWVAHCVHTLYTHTFATLTFHWKMMQWR